MKNRKLLAKILILIGIGVFVFNIFDVQCLSYNNSRLRECVIMGYLNYTKLFISIGVVLVVWGIFMLNKKNKNI